MFENAQRACLTGQRSLHGVIVDFSLSFPNPQPYNSRIVQGDFETRGNNRFCRPVVSNNNYFIVRSLLHTIINRTILSTLSNARVIFINTTMLHNRATNETK